MPLPSSYFSLSSTTEYLKCSHKSFFQCSQLSFFLKKIALPFPKFYFEKFKTSGKTKDLHQLLPRCHICWSSIGWMKPPSLWQVAQKGHLCTVCWHIQNSFSMPLYLLILAGYNRLGLYFLFPYISWKCWSSVALLCMLFLNNLMPF